MAGGAGGAPSPDHADPHPAVSSRKGPRDFSFTLRPRAEDTGLARVPPGPSLTLRRTPRHSKKLGRLPGRFSSREPGGAGGASPVDRYLLRVAEAKNRNLV